MQPDKPSSTLEPESSKNRIRLTWLAIGVGASAFWGLFFGLVLPRFLPELPPPKDVSQVATPPAREPAYQTYESENATVHVVELPLASPSSAVRPSIAVADELATVQEFARRTDALVVLNGGFFDPQNGKTTSHLVSQGQIAGAPAENERLVGNPDLAPYLDQILNRSEFRVYDCGPNNIRYDIVFHRAPPPANCTIQSALGAGPQLLPEDTSYAEGFTDFEDGELVRDAIGSRSPNARSAIALTADSILLIMVAQRPEAPGLTLAEVADFSTSLGAIKLLNLDGGSSASLYYNGQTYFGRLDAQGDPIERPVKSVIVISP